MLDQPSSREELPGPFACKQIDESACQYDRQNDSAQQPKGIGQLRDEAFEGVFRTRRVLVWKNT